MSDRLAAAVRGLARTLDAAAALLLVAVLVVTSARVVGRYVLDLAMPWSEELTRLLFVWLVMLAAARASHMRIELVRDRLAPAPRRWLGIGITTVSIGLLALLVRYGYAMIELTRFDRFTALGLSVQYLYASVVVGGSLWILLLLAATFLGEERADAPPA